MDATLLDGAGEILSEITYRLTKLPGRLVVDWVDRPDALFNHYFNGRGGDLVLDSAGIQTPTVLGTKWISRTRIWYLDGAAQVPDVATVTRPGI